MRQHSNLCAALNCQPIMFVKLLLLSQQRLLRLIVPLWWEKGTLPALADNFWLSDVAILLLLMVLLMTFRLFITALVWCNNGIKSSYRIQNQQPINLTLIRAVSCYASTKCSNPTIGAWGLLDGNLNVLLSHLLISLPIWWLRRLIAWWESHICCYHTIISIPSQKVSSVYFCLVQPLPKFTFQSTLFAG